MSDAAISIRGLCKSFGDVRALDDLDLTLPKGALCAILGHNGAGKTTTIRVLLGLVRPDRGEVRVLGLDPARDGTAIRARSGVLLEQHGLYERMTAQANLDFHGRIQGMPAAERRAAIEAGLRRFGLWERRRERVGRWSRGMRKKLAIARTLLHKPALLLLDEPFTGLDPAAAADVRGMLARLASEDGLSIVLTTHDLAQVERACDQVVIVDRGRVLAQGTLPELQQQKGALTVVIRGGGIAAALLDRLRADGMIEQYELIDRGARVRCAAAARPRLAAALVGAGVELEEMQTVGSSLEELFLSLVESPEVAA